METDFTYTGFFRATEDKNVLIIMMANGITDFRDLKGYHDWHYGDLFVTADGNYVEMNIEKVYEVRYTWDDVTEASLRNTNRLLHIDGETFAQKEGLIFKTSKSYYPSGTKYVVDATHEYAKILRYFNNVLKLHTDTGDEK